LLVPVIVRSAEVDDGPAELVAVGVPFPPHEETPATRTTMTARTIRNAGRSFLRRLVRGRTRIAAIAKGIVAKGNLSLRASAVVVTVTVTGTVEALVGRNAEAGFTVQVVPAGAPPQFKATLPVKPSDDNRRL
jgi:hypothetical protein